VKPARRKFQVAARELPAGALLARYRDDGAYTDCFVTTVPGRIDHARYVEAFYTTPLFKAERLVLAWLLGRPSTDSEARRLAAGATTKFAAWSVEARHTDQVLLCDFLRYTRSWLMSTVDETSGSPGTTLYFGSAIVRRGRDPVSLGFRALLGFHQLYARALLRSAAKRLIVGCDGVAAPRPWG
jgi:hypothetical protein